MPLHLIKKGFNQLHIPYKQEWDTFFSKFYTIYSQINSHTNLSRFQTPEDFAIKHVLDSSVAAPFFKNSEHIIDLGSGGGFPGIVLAILYPEKQFSLIDIIAKKVLYLKEIISFLGLKNCMAFNASQEKTPRKKDTLTCRALGSLEKITSLAKPYIDPHGKIIAYKGKKETLNLELQNINPFYNMDIFSLQVPFLEAERNLVILTK